MAILPNSDRRKAFKDNWRCLFLGSGLCLTAIVFQEVDLAFPNTAVGPLGSYFEETFINNSALNPSGLSEPELWSIFASSAPITGVIACFLGPVLCDNLGRKHSLLLFTIVGFAASAFEAAAPVLSPMALLLGRIVSMLADNLGIIVIPVILAEVAPPALRGTLGVITPLAFGIGNMLAALLGLEWLFGNSNWYIPYLIVTVASAMTIPLVLWMRPTPVELIGRGEEEKARRALTFYRASDEDYLAVQKDSDVVAETNFSSVKLLQLFTDRKLRTQTLLCMAIGAVFTPVLEIIIYSTLLFESAGIESSIAAPLTTGLTVVGLLTILLSFFTVDALPRRRLFLPSVAVLVVCLALLAPTQAVTDYDLTDDSGVKMALKIITAVLLYLSLTAISLGPRVLFFVLVPELLPYRYRITGKCLAMASHMLVCSLLTVLTPPLFAQGLGWTLYVVMFLLAATTGAFIWLYLPETRDKDPHEIFLLFQSGTEDPEVKKKEAGPTTPLLAASRKSPTLS